MGRVRDVLSSTYGKAVYRHPRLANFTGINDGWTVKESHGPHVVLQKGATLLEVHRGAVILSEIRAWRRCYLPPFDLTGKAVLDIGAYCGDTAAFFLARGASEVIAVENDPGALQLLRKNVARNNWNVRVVGEQFSLKQLAIPHDFLKMDIEGAERLLLDYQGDLGPCRLEVHLRGVPEPLSQSEVDRLVAKFGLKEINHHRDNDIWGRDS